MELTNIKDYYKVAKSADVVQRFYKLIHKLAFADDFNKEDAKELLYIIDNEQENLEELAKVFINAGEDIKLITDKNWKSLRRLVLATLATK